MVILNSKASDLGVALGDEEKIRLVDDAFSKICLMINDISIEVKVCASCLLGKMEIVSSGFLLQTLDKKIMMDLKVRKFAKLRTKQLITSVDWASSSSNQAQSSSDSTMNDDDNLNLVTGGSCGAFIHGLEDEFLEVRGESVDALCSLALSCPKLAAKSIDFLVDMFNDEIESVRLKAIIALTKISHCVLLQDDQIDIVLGVIEDTSFEVRESLKVLLEQCRLATKIGLKKTVQALFKNLRKYFSDKYSIWRCFKHLGKHHAKFVISIISNLVGLHPFLDVTEPDINDVYYISSLILIYNAVNENSAILALLPKYIINHYFFLKLKLPELVPNINIIENAPLTQSLIDEKNSKIQEIKNFFFEAKTNFKISVSLNQYQEENSLKILESVRSDILYLSELNDSSLSVACEIMKGFIDCYLIIKRKELNTNSKIKIDNHKLIQIEEAIFKSIKLLMTFTGYSQKEKVILIQLYLFLRALYLKELCNRNSNYNINSYLKTNIAKQDLSKECRSYLSIIRAFEMLIKGEKLNPMTLQIIREIPFYELNELEFADKPECATSLNNGELEILLLTEKTNNYRKMWLDLLEPVSNLEMPIRFTPGLISNVRVKAVLNNFSRFDNLFIQIIYSDNDKQYFPIECSSFKEIQLNKHSLETFINLSNLSFTDNCYIKLCLVMYVDEYNDLKQQIVEASVENCLMRSTSASSHENESNTSLTMDKNLRNNFNIIELSVQIKLYFEPLLARKFM
jgi:integrator complex subunit 4